MINLSEMKGKMVVRIVFVVVLILIGVFLALIGLTVGLERHIVDIALLVYTISICTVYVVFEDKIVEWYKENGMT